MALSSFLTEHGAPEDGMALFGSPPGLPGAYGMALPPGRLPSWGGLMGWP